MIHVYAYAEAAAPEVALVGIGDVPVVGLVVGSFKLYTTLHAERAQPDVPNLLRHNEIAEVLVRTVASAPLRFDAGFDSEEALARDFITRQEQLRLALRLVSRRCEAGVRVRDERAGKNVPAGREIRGRSYLAALAEERGAVRNRQLAKEAIQLNTALEAGAVMVRDVPSVDEHAVVSRAYLVDAESSASFVHRARRLVGQMGVDAVVTGPWPPYSFTTFTSSSAVPDGALT